MKTLDYIGFLTLFLSRESLNVEAMKHVQVSVLNLIRFFTLQTQLQSITQHFSS